MINSKGVSRRGFAVMTGSMAVGAARLYGAAAPTAQDLVKQIQDRLGGDWPGTGVDGIKVGDPKTEVRGIATTAMPTVDVLRQAVKNNLNLIVTHEPTFFGTRDAAAAPPTPGAAPGRGGQGGVSADDPVYKAKKEFIDKNQIVVLRVRDHWQSQKDVDFAGALADSLGWSKGRVPGELALYDIPAASAEDTVGLIRKKLNLRGGLRAVGDPKSKVRRVLLYPGLMPPAVMLKNFGQVDMLIAGEVREWESTYYAFDVNYAGEKRSLVTIGRVASVDPGLRAAAGWLKTFVKGVPIQWISAGDAYWRAS